MGTIRLRCNKCGENFEFDVRLSSDEGLFLCEEEKVEELAVGTRFACKATDSVRGMTDVCVVQSANCKRSFDQFGQVSDRWVEVNTKIEKNRQSIPPNPNKPMTGRKKITKLGQ